MVQKHAARRLHYDFRLEWGGTLVSWAVPKGPSPDPKDKRLAVHVEDHPVEYADFEGVIPEGNYGAGAVIVWDRGLWVPYDDPDEGIAGGKLHFELRGYKLRGEWLLLRTSGRGKGGASGEQGKEWLLRKKPDGWARNDPAAPPFGEESVVSGLTLEEMRDGQTRGEEIRKRLTAARAPRRAVEVMDVELMLARTADGPFSSPDWLFELKYDGYRLLAARRPDGTALLRSRNGHDLTAIFPDVARTVAALPHGSFVLDGELVILDETGRPEFQALQRRSQLRRRGDVERAAMEFPATLFVFDLLAFEGFDLRTLPLVERKRCLQQLLPQAGPLRFSDHVEERGLEMFEKVQELDLEGLVAKRADSLYPGGRSSLWLKVIVERSADFVVCGYTSPRGTRPGFGALLLGVYDRGELVYAGRVGTGFDDQQLEEYTKALREIEQPEPSCRGLPASPDHHWVRPEWVVEVRYKEWTDEGLLRAPAFVRVRDDKPPGECVRRGGEVELEAPPPTMTAEPRVEERSVELSNLDKIFWPAEGYTKGDLIDYYRTVSPWLLPYLKDRPLVLTRYPDGIEGKNFYQKNAPDFLPSWLRTEPMWSDHAQKEIDYLICDDEEMLLYIINTGAIPLHIWPSRAGSLQHPDWCILDLDPKGAPFADVIRLAKAIRALCDEIGLEPYVKTSGSTGLHVLIPLGGQCTFEQSRTLGYLIARSVEAEHKEIATTARAMAARRGRVYLDYLQNRHGQLLVAPYSVRPLPEAPVSAPLEWREVNGRLTPRKFTIRSLPARLTRRKRDPLLPLLTERPDLVGALARLAERMEGGG